MVMTGTLALGTVLLALAFAAQGADVPKAKLTGQVQACSLLQASTRTAHGPSPVDTSASASSLAYEEAQAEKKKVAEEARTKASSEREMNLPKSTSLEQEPHASLAELLTKSLLPQKSQPAQTKTILTRKADASATKAGQPGEPNTKAEVAKGEIAQLEAKAVVKAEDTREEDAPPAKEETLTKMDIFRAKVDVDPFMLLTAEPVEEESPIKTSAVVAEYVAMTLFVAVGCGSACGAASGTKEESAWVLQVALTFGFAITTLAVALGQYSGGHINCAVTLGLVLAGRCTILQGLANFCAQMLGAVTGAALLLGIYRPETDRTGNLGSNKIGNVSYLNALVGEALMTFLLMLVVLETAGHPLAPLAIGFAVFLAHSVLIPVDGCSINPTRSFGPALVARLCRGQTDTFAEMWVFWAGPLLGSALAVPAHLALQATRL